MKSGTFSGFKVPDGLLKIIAMHIKRYYRDIKKLGKLGYGRSQVRVCSDIGISRFRIDNHDVSTINNLFNIPDKRLIVNEFAGSEASDLTVYPLTEILKTFKFGYIVCSVGHKGKRRYKEIHK